MTTPPDRLTSIFLAILLLTGIVYAACGFTPSSYGVLLQGLGAPDAGPAAGASRVVRSDEWAISTPRFQAVVRNRFGRFNQTSFYREDLRSFDALPLADWSLAFKPQLWGFFLLPPATAFSLYHALLMMAFLAGYQLLFRQLGVPSWLAIVAAMLVFFSGYPQFWWTTFGPALAVLPWTLLVVLWPIAWWKKALLCAWVFPVFILTIVYPTLLLTLAWAALILILAFRPRLLRSYPDIGAITIGAVAAAVVVAVYFADVIPIVRNTVYPGHRIAPPGTASPFAVLSEFFPLLTYRLGDYQNLTGINICEIGALGSFLPLLTLFLTRYRALRESAAVLKPLLILLAGFIAITLWEIAPVPAWIGRLLLWNTGPAQRWLFTSGLLLTLASLLIWRDRLISTHPFRIGLFLLLGPIASLLLKLAWLIHKGQSAESALSDGLDDILLCGLLLAVGIAACYVPAAVRAPLLLIAVALVNVYGFARFNPLQPAGPIFQIPDTALLHELRKEEAASPGGVLVDPRFFGATLNGMGFRSVAHVLSTPKLSLFRSYFPAMDAARFDLVFNRFAHIHLTPNALPDSPRPDVIEVPMEVFLPIRNVRQVILGPANRAICAQPPAAAAIEHITGRENQLTIEGWAPWTAETDAQGIRVLSARQLRLSLSTITRPDIAERLHDYRFVKSGFKLQLSAQDGKPVRADDVVLSAIGTSSGEVRLAGCGCP